MIRDLFKDISKYLPAQVIPAVIGIIAIPVITRLFPPENYGIYTVVITTVSFLSTFAIAWLAASIIRFFPQYESKNKVGEFYSIFLKLSFFSIGTLALLFFIVLYFSKFYISNELYSLMSLGVLVFIATSCFQFLLNLLRAKRKVGWYASFQIWQNVGRLGIGVTIVLIFGLGVEGLLWGAALSSFIALPLLWKTSIGGKIQLKAGNLRSSITSEITKYGFPAMAINLLSWTLSLSDRYILQFFRGSHEVGIYSASYAISEKGMFMIASLFLLASSPLGYHIWEKQGIKASQKFVSDLTRYYLIFGLPIALGISILSKPIVYIFTTPEYHIGFKVIPLVTFGAFLVGLAHRFSIGLSFYKRTDLIMFCFVGSVLINVVLNFFFIPKYGYLAAAATTLIAYASLFLFEIFVSRRFFVWKFPFKSLAKVMCASSVMGIVVYFVGNSLTPFISINLILGICIGVIIYFLVLFLLREFKPSEIQAVLALKAKIRG